MYTASKSSAKLFVLGVMAMCLLWSGVASAFTLAGTLYQADGTTADGTSESIVAVVATTSPSRHTVSSTGGTGAYSFTLSTTTSGVEWVLKTAAGDDDSWQDVAYGEGRYVAVGCGTATACNTTSGDRIMTSTDGLTWTAVSSGNALGNNDSWRGVTYGNGIFVAVGSAGARIATSSDGTVWSAVTVSDGNNEAFYGVTYGNGYFVAVACGINATSCNTTAANRVFYSTDGSSWTSVAAAGSNNDHWVSVEYGNGTFVAVSASGDRAMYSTAPNSSWSLPSGTAIESNMWQGVTYGNGKFVAIACGVAAVACNTVTVGGSRVAYSTDGTSWTAVASPAGNDDYWRDVAWTGNLFVAVGGATGDHRVMTSPDGATWTGRTSVSGDNDTWMGVTYANGMAVAVGDSTGTGDSIIQSINFGTTTPITLFVNGDATKRATTLTKINGTASITGINLQDGALRIDSSITNGVIDLTESFYDYDGDTDILFDTDNGTTTISRFPSGEALSEMTDLTVTSGTELQTASNTHLFGSLDQQGVIENEGTMHFRLGGLLQAATGTLSSLGNVVVNSEANWDTSFVPVVNYWSSIAYGNGTFVAVAVSAATTTGAVMTSTDGSVWIERQVLGNDDAWLDVTYGDGTFVAVGPCGYLPGSDCIMTSTDGVNWIARNAAAGSQYWQGVTYGNGTFVAVAGADEVAYSTDRGVTWNAVSAAGNNDVWQAVAYGNGTFVAVAGYDSGDPHLVMTSPDGITWTPRSVAGNDDYWSDVTYGDGKFVAVADACIGGDENPRDCIMYSVDGVNWETSSSPDGIDDAWNSVTYGDGLFVAVGGGVNSAITSRDGITWAIRSVSGDDDGWYGVAYGEVTMGGFDTKLFAMVGTGEDQIAISYNTIAFNAPVETLDLDIDAGHVLSYDVTVNGDYESRGSFWSMSTTTVAGNFSNTGSFENDVALYMTGSGKTFTSSSTVGNLTIGGSIDMIGNASTSNLRVNTGATLDPIAALTVAGDFTNNGTLDFAGTTLYLGGNDPTLRGSFVGANTLDDVVVNPSGGFANWVMQPDIIGDPYFSFLIYEQGKFVAFGSAAGCGEYVEGGEGGYYAGSCAYSSVDGITWATSSLNTTNSNWSDITYGDGLFVAVGSCNGSGDLEGILQDCIAYSNDGITWATSTSPYDTDVQWDSVTFGEGLYGGTFVAFGWNTNINESVAMISLDAITWYPFEDFSPDDNWADVAYGDGTFVAVGSFMNGDSDFITTSPDGENWTTQSAPLGNMNGITYGDGKFVAVGSCSSDGFGCVMYSIDNGVTWATTTADENDDYWNDVMYGGGIFVAVGFSFNSFGGVDDTIMTSPDGITWTTRGLPLKSFSHAAYGDGTYLALGASGIATVEPLVTFTNASTSDLTLFANKKLTINDPLTVDGSLLSNGTFINESTLYLTGANDTVTLADPDIGTVVIDGDIEFLWNATTSSLTIESGGDFEPHNLLTIRGDYIQNGSVDFAGTDVYLEGVGRVEGDMIGTNSFEDVIIDATSWSLHTNPALFEQWLAVAYGDGTFVAVGNCMDGDTTCVMTSSDGATWATTSTPGALGGQWRAITYDNGLFVAVSSYSDGDYVMTSPDGITWTGRSIPANHPGNGWSDVAYGNGTFVAVGVECEYADYCVMTSPDGATWTARSALGDNDFWNAVTYGEGLFATVGCSWCGEGDDLIMTSPDGINWTARFVDSLTVEWSDVTYGNGMFVATDGWVVMTSPDGITWTEGSFDFEGALSSITYGDGYFIGFLGNGYYVTSPDGITWTEHYSSVVDDGGIATYGDEFFVAIDRDIYTSSNTTTFQNNVQFSDVEVLHGGTIVSSSTITVTGDYSNNGKLLSTTSSEFILDGTTQQTVAGNMTGDSAFYDLTISNTSEDGATDQSIIFDNAVETLGTFTMEPGTSAQFPAGSTSTLQHVDLQGTAGNEVYLRSSTDGAYWYMDVPGSQLSVEYVDVKDSYASTTMSAVNSTDSGHNMNWEFGGPTFSGSTTISAHGSGQSSNAFTSQNKTNEELFAFSLIPNSGTATVTEMVFALNGAKKIATSSFSNIRLLRDVDNDGTYDLADTAVGGAGVMALSGQSGSITFTGDFLLSTTQNFIVVADWTAPSNGAFLRVDLLSGGVTAIDDEGTHEIFGSVAGIQHGRNNRGGGGEAALQIGGAPPASPDVEGGGDAGGEEIGNSPDYKRPSTQSGSWTSGTNAYDGTNGTYASAASAVTHGYGGMAPTLANGVTIDGIEVKLEVSGSTAAGSIGVELSWNGGGSWTSAKSTGTLTTSDVVVTLGGPSDTWGRSWAVNEVSANNFVIRVTGAPSSNTVRIDEIQMRVYSSVSGGGGGGGGDI